MKAKTIVLVGLLFVIGTVMLVAETLGADGPAGAVGGLLEEVYEVVMPLPDGLDEFSTDEVKMLVMLGVLRPEGAKQLGLVEGSKCHWVVTYCGGTPPSWYRSCNPGPGSKPCPCPESGSPSTK